VSSRGGAGLRVACGVWRARVRVLGFGLVVGVLVLAAGVSVAGGVVPVAHWSVRMVSLPSHFAVGDGQNSSTPDVYKVLVTNTGAVASSGEPVVVRVTLPGELKATGLRGKVWASGGELECSPNPESEALLCRSGATVAPDGTLEVSVTVRALVASGVAHSEVSVTGGGVEPAEGSSDTPIGSQPVPFAISDFGFSTSGVDGGSELQAAGHPYEQTTSFEFLSDANENFEDDYRPARNPRDVSILLPEGFVGDPQSAPRCTLDQLAQAHLNGQSESVAGCPGGSAVGIVMFVDGRAGGAVGTKALGEAVTPVYNLVPEAGHAAEFGFDYLGNYTIVFYADVVFSDGRYRVRVTTPGTPVVSLDGAVVTLFGEPGVRDGEPAATGAFLRNPSHCGGEPLTARLEVDSWEAPGEWISREAVAYPQIMGCDLLRFTPSIAVTPEQTPASPVAGTVQADSPSGYMFDIGVPRAESPWSLLSSPELRGVTLTLPAGLSISPSAAGGLAGCPATGANGFQMPHGSAHPDKAGEGEAIGATGLSYLTAGNCPGASQVGEVEIDTPLLEGPLTGGVFVADPACGGGVDAACSEAQAENGEMVAVYIEAKGSGVDVKLRGSIEVGGFGGHSRATGLQPGQLRVKFLENPELPVSDIKVKLSGGPRASLASPQSCGTATTVGVLEPWSIAGQDAEPSSSFEVTGCAASEPFAPSFTAGTLVPDAGGSSPFTTTVARQDREQNISRIVVSTPPGIAARLASVTLCPEPQASQGTCSAASEIGHVNVAAGPGTQPFWVEGTVYLTGPYKGAPFGASIVVPAKAGPFNLGNVITRATLNIDPHTAAATVTSDPLPQIVDGIPLRVRNVNVVLDRPGFMLNPTNCSQQQITASIQGALPDGSPGSTAAVSTPYAVAGCKALPFKPRFSASTNAAAHPNGPGASFHVRLLAHEGPSSDPKVSTEANIKRVEVQLPKLLPARLTTLQKSCTQAQFSLNPAGCPEFSFVGTATAHTPVLANALTGPAILVSHGGAQFPDLVIVLQGEGIVLDLVGNTAIKKGITFSKFETVPDAPVTSFELDLPQSPHSALASPNGDLCGQNLVMPTFMEAQNGAQLSQNTIIEVTGCGPKIQITKKKAVSGAVNVTVKTSVKGAVTITGQGLRKTTNTLVPGSHTIRVPLTGAGKTARSHRGKVKIRAVLKTGKKQASSSSSFKF
jgi:hypothetical protein